MVGGGCLAGVGRQRAGTGLPRPREGKWSARGGGCWQGEQVQHAHRGQGGCTAPCQHGDRAGTHRDKTVTGWDRVWGFSCSG